MQYGIASVTTETAASQFRCVQQFGGVREVVTEIDGSSTDSNSSQIHTRLTERVSSDLSDLGGSFDVWEVVPEDLSTRW